MTRPEYARRGEPEMFTTNPDPFAGLSAPVSPAVMQTHVVLMIALVAAGTLFDIVRNCSAKLFQQRAKIEGQEGDGEGAGPTASSTGTRGGRSLTLGLERPQGARPIARPRMPAPALSEVRRLPPLEPAGPARRRSPCRRRRSPRPRRTCDGSPPRAAPAAARRRAGRTPVRARRP